MRLLRAWPVFFLACSGNAAVVLDGGGPAGPLGDARSATIDAPSAPPSGPDAATTAACDFTGHWKVVDIQCNGTPAKAWTVLMQPGNSWAADIDGQQGRFTETLSGCSLTEAGKFLCDQPAVGEFTSAESIANACVPQMCAQFGTLCGATPTDHQVWKYTALGGSPRRFLAEAVAPYVVKTCSGGAAQQDPTQITWEYVGAPQ